MLDASTIGPPRTTLSHDDQRARVREAQRPVEVVGVGLLVGVDEDHVERLGASDGERRSDSSAGPTRTSATLVQSGARQVGARHFGVARVELECDQTAARRQRRASQIVE